MESAKLNVVHFNSEDVIATSGLLRIANYGNNNGLDNSICGNTNKEEWLNIVNDFIPSPDGKPDSTDLIWFDYGVTASKYVQLNNLESINSDSDMPYCIEYNGEYEYIGYDAYGFNFKKVAQ